MKKKDILQKIANLTLNAIPKFGIPAGTPGLIKKNKIPLTNINFNAKKISTKVPGGALKTSKIITNG